MYFRTLFSPQSIVVMYITRNSRHIGLRPKSDYKIGTYLSIYLSIYHTPINYISIHYRCLLSSSALLAGFHLILIVPYNKSVKASADLAIIREATHEGLHTRVNWHIKLLALH